ncbi:hypothetical protein EXU57_19620 [Segetibacter sp. 3557_3]|uniref:hypothetical protein n=1 Tax=Segetibacter sp. 3557_3 TaxID=2547429 RepID=UPI00105906D4|nr:hypothetical protein [Segetibacter sp. 3557_3]TDH21410.1 hypothetical protein EXU57_19620 [Segetibacter sp. 3557_3]
MAKQRSTALKKQSGNEPGNKETVAPIAAIETTNKINVELSTEANLEVFKLEGYIIPLTKTLDNTYRTVITNFPIDGELDYFVHCSGWNKTPWTLKITVNEKDVTTPPIQGQIEKGFSVARGSLKI